METDIHRSTDPARAARESADSAHKAGGIKGAAAAKAMVACLEGKGYRVQ